MVISPIRLTKALVVIVLVIVMVNSGVSLAMGAGEASLHQPAPITFAGITATWDNSGRVILESTQHPGALALELLPNRPFRQQWLQEISYHSNAEEESWSFISDTGQGRYRGIIRFDRRYPGLIHWSVWATFPQIQSFNLSTPDLYPFDITTQKAGGRWLRPILTPKGSQLPAALSYDSQMHLHLLYLVNLSALDPLYARMPADPQAPVYNSPEGLGFLCPKGVLPAQVELPLADAFLYIQPEQPLYAQPTTRYVLMIADVYDRLPQPATTHTDWACLVAPAAVTDLLRPENWHPYAGNLYLKPYVADARPSIEFIAGGDVLVPLNDALPILAPEEQPAALKLSQQIAQGLDVFHDTYVGSIGNNPAPMASVWDSWYWFNGYINMMNLARQGNTDAQRIVLDSAEKLVQVGRAFHYRFPFMMNINTLQPVRQEFYQGDTTGAYIYLMLGYYELTGDPFYLTEAQKAVTVIASFNFDLSYEMHMSGICLAALAWLAQICEEPAYLELANVPLANILQASWLWENNYGWAREYRTWGGLSPISGSAMITAYEMHNVWRYLQEFYQRAHHELSAPVRKLVAELIKQQMAVGRSLLPPFLPQEALSNQPDLGIVDPQQFIPLEDLRSGRFTSGTIGQEIYGAGLPFQFVAAAYRAITPEGLRLFAEYPIVQLQYNAQERQITVELGGTADYTTRLRLESTATQGHPQDWQLFTATGEALPLQVQENAVEAIVPGGSTLIFRLRQMQWQPVGQAGLGAPTLLVAGQSHPFTMELSNPTGDELVVTFAAQASWAPGEEAATQKWAVTPEQLNLPAYSTTRVTLQLPAAPPQPAGLAQITLMAQAGERLLPSHTFLAEIVGQMDAGFSDTFNKAGVWQPYRGSPVQIESGFGTGIFLSQAGHAVAASKELVIDVDRYPILSLNVQRAEGAWALQVVDSDHPEQGLYIQGDTSATGVFHYDLRERLGWHGLQRFRILIIPVGQNKRLWLKWVRISDE